MNMIKNTTLNENEVNLLREQFKSNYAKIKGWDPSNLTTEQMIEITQQKDWKSPGLLFS